MIRPFPPMSAMSAMARDLSRPAVDVGGPPLFFPCSVPVPALFVPCYECNPKISKGHGIKGLDAGGNQNGDISPVFFPVSREFRAESSPCYRN